MKEYTELEKKLSALFDVPLSIFDDENYVKLPDASVYDEMIKNIMDKIKKAAPSGGD